jgi:hypothetical protein
MRGQDTSGVSHEKRISEDANMKASGRILLSWGLLIF